jgi:hypothetical protein
MEKQEDLVEEQVIMQQLEVQEIHLQQVHHKEIMVELQFLVAFIHMEQGVVVGQVQ